MEAEEKQITRITGENKLFDFNFREIWEYRDLAMLLVRRTFVAQYKQTILGPAWAVIQPLLTTVVFTLVFGNLAGLSTDGIPPFLFYMCGNILWSYFSAAFSANSTTFISNAPILGKVYFPRLVMPISVTITQLISFVIQFVMFLIFLGFYMIQGTTEITPNAAVLLTPVFLLQLAMLALGCGIIISSITVKYRDLALVVSFMVQLWMYACPITYSVQYIPERFMFLYMLNPVSPVITNFRYAFLGTDQFQLSYFILGWVVTLILFIIGVTMFNRVEKTFMDMV